MFTIPPILKKSLLPIGVVLAIVVIFEYCRRQPERSAIVVEVDPRGDAADPASPRAVDYPAAIRSVETMLRTQTLDAKQEESLRGLLSELKIAESQRAHQPKSPEAR